MRTPRYLSEFSENDTVPVGTPIDLIGDPPSIEAGAVSGTDRNTGSAIDAINACLMNANVEFDGTVPSTDTTA